jgi:hypothetical protein
MPDEVAAPAKKPLIFRMGAKPGVVREVLLSKGWVEWDKEAYEADPSEDKKWNLVSITTQEGVPRALRHGC